MCDDYTENDNQEGFASGRLSRRGFSAMSLAALAACTTSPEGAVTVVERDVEITTPDRYLGDVMGDLSGRRGHILGSDSAAAGSTMCRATPSIPAT